MVRVLVVLLVLVGCSAKSRPTMVGHLAPDVRLEMLGEEPKLLSEFKGQDTYILFWGTWCAASRAALSKLRAMSDQSNGVFLAVSGDAEGVDLKDWLDRNGRGSVKYVFSGNQIADEAFMAFDINELPVFVVIDRAGKVVFQGDFERFTADSLVP